MSRRQKVKMYRVRPDEAWICPAYPGLLVVIVVIKPGEPASEPVHGGFGVWMLVDEVTQARGEPTKRHLLVAASLR